MQFLPPNFAPDKEVSVFEHLEVLHDTEARHWEMPLDVQKRAPVLLSEQVENLSAGWMRQGAESIAHTH